MSVSEDKEWVRPYQLAKKRGVSRQTIYRLIREGKLESRKIKITLERLEVKDEA